MRCEFSPWVGRAPGGGHGNPLQYFAWTIPWTEEPEGSQSVGSQSRMGLKWLSTHAGYEHWYSTTNLSSAGFPTLSTAPGFFFSPGSHAVSHRALSYHVSLVSSSLGQFPQALSSLITALLKSSGQLLCRMFLIRGVSGAFPELDWGFSFLAQTLWRSKRVSPKMPQTLFCRVHMYSCLQLKIDSLPCLHDYHVLCHSHIYSFIFWSFFSKCRNIGALLFHMPVIIYALPS